jgi:hypothetical protein
MSNTIVAGVVFYLLMEIAPSLYINFSSHNNLYVILALIISVQYIIYRGRGLRSQVTRFTSALNSGFSR